MLKLISYSSTRNLGDAIQTIAASYFLKSLNIEKYEYTDRSNLTKDTLVYGWHRNSFEELPERAIFLSLHSQMSIVNRIDRDILVGCRDSWTSSKCEKVGLKSLITGCITINIPKRSNNTLDCGILFIDSSKKKCANINQEIDEDMTWEDQLLLAKDRLALLSTASLVYTTRLHILLPCIAMGVPVVLDEITSFQPERFSFFKDLIPLDKPIELSSGIREELIDIWKKNSSKILDSANF